jgi:hypothetical protein
VRQLVREERRCVSKDTSYALLTSGGRLSPLERQKKNRMSFAFT